ncbi:hypothetical protein [Methylotenera sp. 1P/1]|uniref:hypothetical protein n=1 Tax=Methylotenera sp. 1P/1 TaxID=1131551 RepID=UPI000375552B|nr:hypothetical protein [Methylotenera sp. 1P/1]
MKNIELFNYYATVALGNLYENFPIPITLSGHSLAVNYIGRDLAYEKDITAAIANDINPDSTNCPMQETKLLTENESNASATIVWLVEAGYIIKKTSGDLSNKYVLSTKGLEVLSCIPDSIGGKSLGTKLLEASNNVAGETSKALISATIGQVIGAAFRVGMGYPAI